MNRLRVALVMSFLLLAPAAFAQVTGMLSPTRPVIVDSNGDGMPGAGDGTALPSVPIAVGAGVLSTITNPWSCGGNYNQVLFTNQVGGTWRTAARQDKGGRMQTAAVDTVSGNRAIHMTMDETGSGKTGGGGFVDTNTDGIYDRIVGSTPDYTINIGMVFADTTGDGMGDYVSIPWAQSSLLGVNHSDSCGVGGSRDPQIWVPLADTDGDGLGDSVVLDLDGGGVPDPNFLWGPIIGPAAATVSVPSLSTIGLILLAAGLGFVGAFVARGGVSLGV